jgi:predicted transposase YbfD/YdcC
MARKKKISRAPIERNVGNIVLVIHRHFDDLKDPRKKKSYWPLSVVIVLSVLGTLCGADGWDDLELFAEMHEDWLREVLPMPDGTPSDSTFERVLKHLKPSALQQAIISFVRELIVPVDGRQIALDGKALRRAHDRAFGGNPLHLLQAFEVDGHVMLGQVRVEDKSNEIPAGPLLLDSIDARGAVVSADAMHCQRETVESVRAAGADYLLAVKDNQPTLHVAVTEAFADGYAADVHETSEKNRGRHEVRTVRVRRPDRKDPRFNGWMDLHTIVQIERTVTNKGERRSEIAHYISSISDLDAERLGGHARRHWRIENEVHWCLDMTFGEDQSRTRRGHAQENLAILRRFILGVLKRDKTLKASLRGKRKMCGWNPRLIFQVLAAAEA